MTAAKSLERNEVERVMVALRNALMTECPDYPEGLLDSPPDSQAPTSRRGVALWDAHRLAWSAWVRFTRRKQLSQAKKNGQAVAFFDDSQNDLAIISLERARSFVRNAAAAVQKNIQGIQKARARLGLQGEDLENLPQQLAAIEKLGKGLDLRIRDLKTFRGIRQARTRSDWDEFLSTTAKRLLDVGFGTREVAGMLTGKSPDAVDRATLEKFRQRVNRLGNSTG